MEILVYSKSNSEDPSIYMSIEEIDCKCNYAFCTRTLLNARTLEKYNIFRKYYGKRIRFTSGYRCQTHNWDVSGTRSSYHLLGSALDMQPWGPENFDEELDKMQELAEQYFDVVIRYEDFIHCHMLT